MMGDHQQQQAWREDTNEKTNKHWSPSEIKRQRLLEKVQVKYPKKHMKMKMAVLDDLLSQFKGSNGSEDRAKDGFHFVKKSEKNTQVGLNKNRLRTAGMLMKVMKSDNAMVSDLVTEISSSKFKIVADPKTDFNLNHGVSTMSCYDKVPREPSLDLSDSNSLDSRPDVTQKLENVSIDCDSYNSINHSVTPKDLLAQTMSLDIGANVQSQASSQSHILQNDISFSRKFREYCTNMTKPKLNESLKFFLSELSRLQKNLYNRDNVKGRYRRRYYVGFKETERRLPLKKIKFIIIAPDLDKNKDDGELDNLVRQFIESCKRHKIAIIFGLSRRTLGYLTRGKGFVSCVGVANYEALEDKLEEVLKDAVEAKNEFKTLNGESDKKIDVNKILNEGNFLISERIKLLFKALAESQY